jgi:hypothetical protein
LGTPFFLQSTCHLGVPFAICFNVIEHPKAFIDSRLFLRLAISRIAN